MAERWRWTTQPCRLEDFDGLWPAEQTVWERRDSGQTVVVGQFWTHDGRAAAPPPRASRACHIRASFIRWLAIAGDDDPHRPHEKGVQVNGALIVSDGPDAAETPGLDLEGCAAPRDLVLQLCRFEDAPLLRSARLANLHLGGSATPGLRAHNLSTSGGVFLRHGFESTGDVSLVSAQIGGNLSCVDATLEGQLNANHASIAGNVLLRHSFRAERGVALFCARIGGNLDCERAMLRDNRGVALFANGLSTGGGVVLTDGFRAEGAVHLLGARIGGDLNCTGAKLQNEDNVALLADGLSTTGGVFLRERFTARGEVRLLGARIGASLDCTDAKLRNKGGDTLTADRLATTGDVVLADGFTSDGRVRLPGVRIGGNLDCTGAKLRKSNDRTLQLDSARIDGNLILLQPAEIAGAIDLSAAQIGHLNDDPACWPREVVLDRCVYAAFTGSGVDAATRIDWLDRQRPADYGKEFWPQPWEQCA